MVGASYLVLSSLVTTILMGGTKESGDLTIVVT